MDGLGGVEDGCFDSFVPGCLAGRDGALSSGRSYDDLAYCRTTIEASGCAELGSNMGAMATGVGELARCVVDPQ